MNEKTTLERLREHKESVERIYTRLAELRIAREDEKALSDFFQVEQIVKDLITTRKAILDISFHPESFDGRFYVNEALSEFRDQFPALYGCIRPYPIACYIVYVSPAMDLSNPLPWYFSLVLRTEEFIRDNLRSLQSQLLREGQLSLFDPASS